MARHDVTTEQLLMTQPTEPDYGPLTDVDFPELERSLRRPRTLFSFMMTWLVAGMTLLALIPLFSVVGMLLWRGGRKLSLSLFTQLPPAPLELGGGFGNAIVGTLIMVALATIIGADWHLQRHISGAGREREPFGYSVRFAAKVMTGFPSILAGVFAYGVLVLLTGGFSAFAGGAALSILMLPTIILTAEDAIRMVQARMREAAIGMGATNTQAVWMVLLPTALPGILTGVMLAVARAAGKRPFCSSPRFSAITGSLRVAT